MGEKKGPMRRKGLWALTVGDIVLPVPPRRATTSRLIPAGLLALSACAGLATAQPVESLERPASVEPEDDGPFDGRLVREIRVLVAPVSRLNETVGDVFQPAEDELDRLVRNQLRLREGLPYRARVSRGDLSNLDRLGRFGTVDHLVQPLSDGTVIVTFRLREQPIIQDVQVVGNRRIADQKLARAIELLQGTPVDRLQLDRASRRIKAMYRESGYYLADVTVDLDELAETGIVLFRIREGQRLRISGIRFEGNESFERGQLMPEIRTEASGIFVRGTLDEDALNQDTASIVNFYRARGYLDARADREIRTSPNGREAIITFLIDEGPLYTLRDIEVETVTLDGQIEPNPVYSAEQIKGLAGLNIGDTFGDTKVERALQIIRDAYGKLGYVDVRVNSLERRLVPDPITGELPQIPGIKAGEPLVDLVIQISEGERFRTGEVLIAGNTTTRHNVIRRQISVKPDRPLDRTALRQTERDILSTRLFNTAERRPRAVIQRESAEDPGFRDILVEVTETNTGALRLGATVNSDDGLVGFIEYEQRNFDVFDTPDTVGELFRQKAFRGGGQTLRVTAQPGTVSESYLISLSDPSIGDSRLGASVAAEFSSREFTEYSQDRVSLRTGISRQFGTVWSGSLFTRFDFIRLTNIDPANPVDFFTFKDQDELTALGASLRRTTADDRIRPTRGQVISFNVEQIGALGGDLDFTKLTTDHRIFFNLNEDFFGRKTLLQVNSNVAYIPQGQSAAPFFERFYLGGRTIRGLDFRTVSPKGIANDSGLQTRDPVGGTFSFLHSWEIEQPIAGDVFSIVLFTDTGTVLTSPGLEEYRITAGAGARIYLPISPAPLALDFGIPLASEELDDERFFTFSFDIPF